MPARKGPTDPEAYAEWKREQQRAALKRWREKNRERYLELNRANAVRSRQLHPDKVRERIQAWTERNKERKRATDNAWRERNPGWSKRRYAINPFPKLLSEARRRRTFRNAAGRCTPELLHARFAMFGWKCWMCNVQPYAVIDHVIPLAKGGSNWPANLRPACRSCNSRKGARSPWALLKSSASENLAKG